MIRSWIKAGAAGVLCRTGMDRVAGTLTGASSAPVVLGYHRVVEDFESSASTAIPSLLISAGMLEMCNVPFAEQQERVANVIMASGARRVAIDASPIGSEFAERMQLRFGDYTVEACAFSAPFKEQIAGRMRNRFIDRTIRIPRHEKVRNDLHSVRKTVTAAGNIRLNAPREEGSHADRFWACALACHAAAEDTGPIEICCPEPVGRMQTRDPYRDEQEQGINRGKSDYVPW
jgi:phage FluMu gp28-like protein